MHSGPSNSLWSGSQKRRSASPAPAPAVGGGSVGPRLLPLGCARAGLDELHRTVLSPPARGQRGDVGAVAARLHGNGRPSPSTTGRYPRSRGR